MTRHGDIQFQYIGEIIQEIGHFSDSFMPPGYTARNTWKVVCLFIQLVLLGKCKIYLQMKLAGFDPLERITFRFRC